MEYFKEEEFMCKCGCGINNYNKDTARMLDQARKVANIPFKINRACSCPSHNKKVGGSDTSSHISTKKIECTAFDISCTNSNDRFKMIEALYLVGFNRIGIAKSFIHVDNDKTKPKDLIWVY